MLLVWIKTAGLGNAAETVEARRLVWNILIATRQFVSNSFPPNYPQKARRLRDEGVRELTLLGQNVNSYHDQSDVSKKAFPSADYNTSAGFGNTFRSRGGAGAYFAELLAAVRLERLNPTSSTSYSCGCCWNQ